MTNTFIQLHDLPAKLRSIIYNFAIEDSIDRILSPRPDWLGYCGALALLHVSSRTIRGESACEMLPLVEAEHEILEAYEHACWIEMQLNLDDSVSMENWIAASRVKLMMGEVRFMSLRCM